MGEVFTALANMKIIDIPLAEKLKKAVSFRNISIHQYSIINWEIVWTLINHHMTDYECFISEIITYCDKQNC